jgi:hypothetical protein
VLRPNCVWLACLSAAGALGELGQQYSNKWLLPRSSAMPEMAKRPVCRRVAECGLAPCRGSVRSVQHGPWTATLQSLPMSEMRLLGCMTLCAHKYRGYSRSGRHISSIVSSLLYECVPREDRARYWHSKAGKESRSPKPRSGSTVVRALRQSDCVVRLWRKTLGKRSHKDRVTWAFYSRLLAALPLPEPVFHRLGTDDQSASGPS